MMASGQEVSEALCGPHRKPLAGFQSCNIRDCPARWFTSMWSECSVSCGEGSHSRQVMCKQTKANGTVQVVSPRACASKDRPLGRKPCSVRPCVQQATDLGSQCPGRCMGQAMRMQHHHTPCAHNSSNSDCEDRRRLGFRRNCTSGPCEACWRVGPWKPCTAVCGRGFQSRKVNCIHTGSCKPMADRHCVQMKPASWRHCFGPSCDSTYSSQETAQTQLTTVCS